MFLFLLSNRINFKYMRTLLFIFSGIFVGLYLSWPGILISKNWKCFNKIIEKSLDNKIAIKVLLEVSPSYLIKGNNKRMISKIRVVADACFR